MSNQRSRFWIDSFQTRMMCRILFYCIAYQVSLWIILTVVHSYFEGMEALAGQALTQNLAWPALLPVAAFLGVITIDAVRYVHRVVGPIYRFRKTIQSIAAGEPVDLVKLRRQDFLQDIMKDLNDMIHVLEEKGAVVIKDRQLTDDAVGVK